MHVKIIAKDCFEEFTFTHALVSELHIATAQYDIAKHSTVFHAER